MVAQMRQIPLLFPTVGRGRGVAPVKQTEQRLHAVELEHLGCEGSVRCHRLYQLMCCSLNRHHLPFLGSRSAIFGATCCDE